MRDHRDFSSLLGPDPEAHRKPLPPKPAKSRSPQAFPLMAQHLRCVFAVALAIIPTGCCSTTLFIGAPQLRYDHNRTQALKTWAYNERHDGPPTELTLAAGPSDEVYRPASYRAFPRAASNGATNGDLLPAASLVPVFTGVPLPLSHSPPTDTNAVSDRDDLLDFLADGILSQAGVERGGALENIAALAEKAYTPMLDLLESATQLKSREAVLAWASTHCVNHTFNVVDSRYRARAFADIVGLHYRDFWFVLYRLPKAAGYSRLVVVPGPFGGQDFDAKTLNGSTVPQ